MTNTETVNTMPILATPAIEDQDSDYEESADWEEQYHHNSSQARCVIDEAVSAGWYIKGQGKGDNCKTVNIMKVMQEKDLKLGVWSEE